jgi:peroxiredoxin
LSGDVNTLPPDLPVPIDDGAADHLRGCELPSLELPTTGGQPVNFADAAHGTLVVYLYPRTGLPGQPPPATWDEIPGARGCTPQACSFRDAHAEIAGLGAQVLGVSAQSLDEQQEVAERLGLPYRLASDADLTLAAALRLPTFEFEGTRLYKRLTLIARRGRIAKVFYPVFPPDRNARDVAEWLRRER